MSTSTGHWFITAPRRVILEKEKRRIKKEPAEQIGKIINLRVFKEEFFILNYGLPRSLKNGAKPGLKRFWQISIRTENLRDNI